jgi:hypothetical protein
MRASFLRLSGEGGRRLLRDSLRERRERAGYQLQLRASRMLAQDEQALSLVRLDISFVLRFCSKLPLVQNA